MSVRFRLPVELFFVFLGLFSLSRAWRLVNHIDGRNWQEHFSTEQIHVNNEYVNFLNFDEIRNRRLAYSNGTSLMLRPDTEGVVPAGALGRNSVRIRSKAVFNHGLFIADVEHMPPQQCGVWPAFFLLGKHWPQDGEIDFIEGVNNMPHNQITIHTKQGCSPGVGPGGERGQRIGERDCGANGAFVGCGISHNVPNGYGAGLNSAGGAIYATQWTNDGIRVWHFPRRAAPRDILSGNPDTRTWGQPVANWAGGCDFPNMFRNLQIVILTTFCGEWAGKQWGQSGCGSRAPTCEQFVGGNPQAFRDSYWKIRSIRVYQ